MPKRWERAASSTLHMQLDFGRWCGALCILGSNFVRIYRRERGKSCELQGQKMRKTAVADVSYTCSWHKSLGMLGMTSPHD